MMDMNKALAPNMVAILIMMKIFWMPRIMQGTCVLFKVEYNFSKEKEDTQKSKYLHLLFAFHDLELSASGNITIFKFHKFIQK